MLSQEYIYAAAVRFDIPSAGRALLFVRISEHELLFLGYISIRKLEIEITRTFMTNLSILYKNRSHNFQRILCLTIRCKNKADEMCNCIQIILYLLSYKQFAVIIFKENKFSYLSL